MEFLSQGLGRSDFFKFVDPESLTDTREVCAGCCHGFVSALFSSALRHRRIRLE
jgi:hypothetical protein